jgi:hypothetical protein
MNERIRELAEQCYHRYSEHNIDLEKFARSIIEDCIKACGNHVDIESFGIYPIRAAMVTRACENNIKEHFNLETNQT